MTKSQPLAQQICLLSTNQTWQILNLSICAFFSTCISLGKLFLRFTQFGGSRTTFEFWYILWHILGEYSSVLKPSRWINLQVNWITLYQNNFVSKRPVTLPITCSYALRNFMLAKKFLVNDKITTSCPTNMPPKYQSNMTNLKFVHMCLL